MSKMGQELDKRLEEEKYSMILLLKQSRAMIDKLIIEGHITEKDLIIDAAFISNDILFLQNRIDRAND